MKTNMRVILLSILINILAFTFAGTPAVAQNKGSSEKKQASDVDVNLLLSQLGAEDYDTREAATMALVKKGKAVEAAVKKLHDKSSDPEVKNRCAYILKKLEGGLKAPKPKERYKGKVNPKLPKTKSVPGFPGLPDVPGLPNIPGLPDINSLFKDMQLPEGLKEIFDNIQKELQKGLGGNKKLPNLIPPKALKSHKKINSATGLGTKPLSAALKTHLRLKDQGGALVTKVQKGSWGAKSGIKLHDILLTIKGIEISSLDDLDILTLDKAKAVLIRRGKRITLTLPKRIQVLPKTEKDRDF